MEHRSGRNIAWKVEIPGLAHSSPIVWGDRLFLTSAISSRADATFKPGLYGEGTASEDRTPQKWAVIALDRKTGRTVWQRTAYEGVPREKRHIKATYANATPVTDGRYVVAFFGSQGLFAFDMDGTPVWKKDLGVLNTGAYDLPEYEWGTASSPIIYKDLVIVQCDTQNESFVMALGYQDRPNGVEDGPPGAAVVGHANGLRAAAGGSAELVTNASNFVRGYDPDTGEERWRLGRQLEDHRADAGVRRRTDYRRERARAGAARSSRFDPAATATSLRRLKGTRATSCSGARPAEDPTCPRRSSTAALVYVLGNPVCSMPTSCRPARRSLPSASRASGQRLQRVAGGC